MLRNIFILIILGKGIDYIPGVASLAAAHRGKVKNIRLSTIRDSNMTPDAKSCILNFEKKTVSYDRSMKLQAKGMYNYIHASKLLSLATHTGKLLVYAFLYRKTH